MSCDRLGPADIQGGPVVHLALLLVPLLLLSGLFSASETALFSLPRETLRRFSGSSRRLERLVARLLERPRSLLITILFGNLVVNISFYAVASVATWKAASAGHQVEAALLGVCSLLAVIVFGEVTPKALALAIPEAVASFSAVPLLALRGVFAPVRIVVSTLSQAVTNIVVRPHHRQPYVTREELVMLVDLSREQGLIDDQTGIMMQEMVDFADIRVHEVMVPRVDLALFEVNQPVEELVKLVEQTRHGRVPVYEGKIDNVIGIIYAKDVLLHPDRPLRESLREVLFVPESQTIESLLADLRRLGRSLAMVVDEYGGIAGLVTLEDITEEIVGEIRDEYDRPVESVIDLGENTYSLSGRLGVRDWSELFEVSTGVEQFEVDTLGGFVAGLLGRVPSAGESVTFGNLRFTVESVHKRRIERVRVEIIENGVNGDRGDGQ